MTEDVCYKVEDMQGHSFINYRNVTGNIETLYEHSFKCYAASHDELNSVTLNRVPKRVVGKIINRM
jgi:hypothetical protein